MYCGKCGKEIRNNALFCKYCGAETVQVEKKGTQEKSPRDASVASDSDFVEKIKNSFSEIGTNIKEHNYTAPEIVVLSLVLLNAIIYLVSTFSYAGNIMLFLISVFIGYLYLRKERFDSVLIPVCITFITFYDMFFSRLTVEAMQYKLPKFLIDVSLVILYFLFTSGVIRVRRTKQIVRDIIAGLLLIICLYRMVIMIVCVIHKMEAMAIMESIGYMLFAIEFLMMILFSEGDIVSSIRVDSKIQRG